MSRRDDFLAAREVDPGIETTFDRERTRALWLGLTIIGLGLLLCGLIVGGLLLGVGAVLGLILWCMREDGQ